MPVFAASNLYLLSLDASVCVFGGSKERHFQIWLLPQDISKEMVGSCGACTHNEAESGSMCT